MNPQSIPPTEKHVFSLCVHKCIANPAHCSVHKKYLYRRFNHSFVLSIGHSEEYALKGSVTQPRTFRAEWLGVQSAKTNDKWPQKDRLVGCGNRFPRVY